jgi:hypothetical protein
MQTTQPPSLQRSLMLVALLGASCQRYWVCDEVDQARTQVLPMHLSETGLYADIATGELAAGVAPFTPRFPLWSDGSEKQRWLLLPEGAQIDTSNMDDWTFPEGTKVWKQFSNAGVRIETRLLEKRGPSEADWIALAYLWQPDGQDAIAAPLGAIDAQHTEHNVPAAGECVACHGGRRSFILGFSALQLADSAAAGELDLKALAEQGRLSDPPASIHAITGGPVELAALGYLHANCSHCHNQTRPERDGARCFEPKDGYDFTLAVGKLGTVTETPTYRTVVGHAVKPGDPDDSRLYELVSSRGMFRQMPPLATEKVDSSATANLRAWIEGL